MTGRLAGRAVVVSGSTTGIGEGIARMAAEEGASVVIHGRSVEQGEKVAKEIREAGGSAIYSPGDLVDPETPRRVVEECVRAFGKIDAVVNNAAVSARSTIDDTTPEFFDRMMAINARAPMLFVQAAVSYFRKQGQGRVVNIGSVNAYMGGGRLLAYSMTKGALMTMTRNLANTLCGDGIRVNQLNIGWTLTPNEYELIRGEGGTEDWPEEMGRRMPYGRLFYPRDIAHAVCYLLSDEAELLNGSVIDFDQKNRIGGFG